MLATYNEHKDKTCSQVTIIVINLPWQKRVAM
jgi:hypothetical protein